MRKEAQVCDYEVLDYKQVIERERMEELVGIGMGRSEGGWE